MLVVVLLNLLEKMLRATQMLISGYVAIMKVNLAAIG
jgi:hypothetical protein